MEANWLRCRESRRSITCMIVLPLLLLWHPLSSASRPPPSLHLSALQGDVAIAVRLLDAGASVHAVDAQQRTPLHAAALSGHAGVVRILLDYGAAIDVSDSSGYSPLMFATYRGHADIVSLLIARGASVEHPGPRGYTALHVAAIAGRVGICKALLEHGAAPNGAGTTQWTPLHAVIDSNHTASAAMLKLLVAFGASVTVTDPQGATPLHLAARGHSGQAGLLLKLLLERGAAIDAVDLRGYSPLHTACESGHAASAALLLAHGAAASPAASKGFTALHAAALNGHAHLVALLLDRSASLPTPLVDEEVNAVDLEERETPLHMAVTRGHISTACARPPPVQRPAAYLQPCTCARARPRAVLLYGRCSLYIWCALSGAAPPRACRRLLLERGANIQATDADGWGPLHGAASEGMAAAVALLLERGAPLHAKDHDGCTCLHTAIAGGHADVVELLMSQGAQTDVRSVDGLTPRQLAADILGERFRLFLSTEAAEMKQARHVAIASLDAPSSGGAAGDDHARVDGAEGAARETSRDEALDEAIGDDLRAGSKSEASVALAQLLLLQPSPGETSARRASAVIAGLMQRFTSLASTFQVHDAIAVARQLLRPGVTASGMSVRQLELGSRLLRRLLLEAERGGTEGCPTVSASSVKSGDALRWRVPTIIQHHPSDVRLLSKGALRSKSALLKKAGRLIYTSTESLLHETALSSAVIHRIRSGASTLKALLAQRNETMNFISYNTNLTAAVIPPSTSLPPALRVLTDGLHVPRRAVSLGLRGQAAFMHRHYVAVFTQVSGSKGWVLAPPVLSQGAPRRRSPLSHG